jgi:diguanylate cyclase (GGDEF)-like protein/PAS domain S-box-containing protein
MKPATDKDAKVALEHFTLLERLLQVALEDAPLETTLNKCLDGLLSVSWLSILPKGGVLLKEPESDVLKLVGNRNLGPQITKLCDKVAFGHCLCGRAAAQQATQHANCVDHRHETRFDGMKPHGHYNVPIMKSGDLLGVLVVYLEHGHQKDAREIAFLERFADLLALIISARAREEQLHATEEQLRSTMAEVNALMSSITKHSIYSQTDARGIITHVNQAFCEISGYERDELIGAPHRIINSGIHGKYFWRSVWKAIAAGDAWHGEIANKAKDGSIYWVDTILMPIRGQNGQIERYLSLRHDITERKRAEEALSRMGRIVEHASNEVFVFEADTLNFLLVNRGARDNLGYSSEEVASLTPIDIKPEFDEHRFRDMIQPLLDGETDLLSFETVHQRKDGTIYPCEINLHYARAENPPIFLGFVQDITRRKEEEQAIRKLAMSDPLTGLANRNHLMESLDCILDKAGRARKPVQLLYVDLNKFKLINDTLGHAAGDMVLTSISQRILDVFGKHSIVARIGGDEFVVALANTDRPTVESSVERLVAAFRKPILICGQGHEVGASIGLASYPDDGLTGDELLQAADIAMYQAKTRGVPSCIYLRSMKTEMAWRQQIGDKLSVALAKEKLKLAYQPLIDLKTRKMVGCEALLRWTDPDLGPITPTEIIAIADERQLMSKLGNWIVDRACQQLSCWRSDGLQMHGRLAINIAGRQIEDGSVVNALMNGCNTYNIDPTALEVEVTEVSIMNDAQAVRSSVNKLQAKGIKIAIDDFGTGYSSMARLRQFKVDKLKIDRTFVQDILVDQASREIVAATIGLAKGLGLLVLAEGIEQEEQGALLQRLGCEQGQGYLFDRPLSPESFAQRWLATPYVGQTAA